MNNIVFTKAALRYRALFLDINRKDINLNSIATLHAIAFVIRMRENGFCLSEELYHAINGVSADTLASITTYVNEAMGIDLNWASLVKGWDTPTGESHADHLVTWFANMLGDDAGLSGTTLPCGHFIPDGTFPLERYNGCPFCGTPFKTANYVYKGQASKLKELRLFTIEDISNVFNTLLSSATPLDGTQKETLSMLLKELPLSENVNISMKETAMFVVKTLVENGKDDDAQMLLSTPTDILRYLWFAKTGYAQIIEPRTLIAHAGRLYRHMWGPLDKSVEAAIGMKNKLLLKYNRNDCYRVARWMNALSMTATQAAENMNPKRGMWVRFIRALRLAEYSRKAGFEHLSEIIDVFYRQDYSTWQGQVDSARKQNDVAATLTLLKQRPGLFARCLFATMLRFDCGKVLSAFEEISDKLPSRLILSLVNAAETYFDSNATHIARPITGGAKTFPPNKLLTLYNADELKSMADSIKTLYKTVMTRRFAAQSVNATSIYIDPILYDIPLSVGDRSATVQDTSCALMGTRIPVEGDSVRLFLHWGKGLPAQWLDMDLSCVIAYPDGRKEECGFFNLTCVGAKHSGDFQQIPDLVGTAEYIELTLPELDAAKAEYVTFTCNAYSNGALSPNLMVGWMNSAYKMEISHKDGVAYDPSCVQHIVRVSEGNLSKGLVFGVLDVKKREIIWLEMPFTSQTVGGLDCDLVRALLNRLENKISIGDLLALKAQAQSLTVVDNPEQSDESYTYEWALNPAQVSTLLNK
ncbi:MAG: hypothetical protein IK120_01105 [Muribaculaceae bacterium]|nr:hypothetical protein [Muribaculaceae bacterium]